MNRPIIPALCAGLLLVLVNYPGVAGAEQYPQEVTGVADTPEYPLSAAGFQRVGIYRYQPGDVDISVGYNMFTSDAQIASTIYRTNASVFPGLLRENDPLTVLFEEYSDGLARYHTGARKLGEDSVILVKNGKQYKALRVFFRFDADFRSRRQKVYSGLMLWRDGDVFVKLRSTMPYEMRDQWEERNTELLDAVDWTKPPF